MKKILTILGIAAATLAGGNAADLYWNGANVSASPANGGTGTWSTSNAWRSGTATGSQATWAAATGGTDNAIFAGTAGTVTLGSSGSTNFTGANISVNTTGYTISSASGSRNLVFTGSLTLSSSVALTLDLNNTNATWGFGSLSLGSGAALTLQGIATANNANRVNLSAASTTSSGGSIVLNGTAAGVTGFVGTASGVALNTNISNNSATSATMLGATSGNSLTYGGIVSGSANLQISAGQSGGAGITTLNNTNNFTGNTYLNQASSAVLRIGVSNALPSGTTVFFGASAGGGTTDTGGSIDLNGQNLAIGALDSATSTRGVANNTGTLSTLTIGKAAGSNTFGGVIGTVVNTSLTTQTNNIAVVKAGASTQTFSGANTYTGGTTINAGTLLLSGGGTIGTGNLVLGGGTLSVAGITGSSYALSGTQSLTGTGTILGAAGKTLTVAGTLAPGSSSTSTITLDTVAVTLSGTSTFEFTNTGFTAGSYDLVQGTVGGTESVAFGGTLNLNFSGGTYTNGSTVTIFDVDSYSGGFGTVSFSGLGVGQSATFDATNGLVTVVPEPKTWVLIGIGLSFMLWNLRRKRNLVG